MTKHKLSALLVAALSVLGMAGQALAAPTSLVGKRVLIHLKTGFKQDDNQPCVAFDVALAALKAGAKVEMFFDAAAVVDLKIWQGKPTSLAYEIPDKLKDILVAEYKTSAGRIFQRLSKVSCVGFTNRAWK